MFYVTGVKIYLMELDELLKVYREVHIVDGRPVALNTGTPIKPAVRTVLTLDEIVAKFGRNYPPSDDKVRYRKNQVR